MHIQLIRNQSTKTFGQLLKPKIKQNPKPKLNSNTIIKDKVPTGYEYITSNFPNDLNDFRSFMKNNNTNADKHFSRFEIESLLDCYSKNININVNNNLTQKKMILKAYKKANLNKSLNIKFPSKNINKTKLTLLLKRNWPVLEYVANESGIKVLKSEDENEDKNLNKKQNKIKHTNNDNENNESWVIDDKRIEVETSNGLKLDNKSDSKGSFKEMLKSINKVTKSHHENVLPKMTKFKPSPTINHSINKIDIALEKKNFQEFLDNAKKDNDFKKNMLFKSELNYEFSKQLLSDNPRLIERGNFFTPILIPGTIFEMINNNKVIKKTENDKLEILKVFKDGYSVKVNNCQFKNIYQTINKLSNPSSFMKIIKKYLRNDWELIDGNENYLVFARNSNDYYKKNIIRISVISCSALLTYLGITYAICI